MNANEIKGKALGRFFQTRRLSLRLLASVVLISSAVAVFSTAAQLYFDYRLGVDAMRQNQVRVAELVSVSLANSLWYMGYDDVRLAMNGIHTLQQIQFAELVTAEDGHFTVGQLPVGEFTRQRFPIQLTVPETGQTHVLGSLDLVSALEPVYRELWDRVLVILATQTIKTLVVSILFLLLVWHVLTRHLERIASFASRLNLERLVAPLQLSRRPPRVKDELDHLVNALNGMRMKLLGEADQLRQAETRSISERDQAVRAVVDRDRWLQSMSQELRTPVSALEGISSLLAETRLDDDQADAVRLLKCVVDQLSVMVSDMTESRGADAQWQPERVFFDWRAMVADVLEMLRPMVREYGGFLESRVDPDFPAQVLGDPIRLRQLLVRLACEVIRRAESECILIETQCLGVASGAVTLRVSIEEGGELRQPTVHRMPRSPRAMQSMQSVVGHLERQLNATVGIELDDPGHNAAWIDLELPVSAHVSVSIDDSTPLRGQQVLLFEPNDFSRKLTSELLQQVGAEVRLASTDSEAEVMLRDAQESLAKAIPLLVVDEASTDHETRARCVTLRRLAGNEARLLVMVTDPKRGSAALLRDAGADGYLHKSQRERYLRPMLERMLTGPRTFHTRLSIEADHQADERVLPAPGIPVLLVEDNEFNQRVTRSLLERLGCQVVVAVNGEQALATWAAGDFDMVLMDCVMPVMDGFEATRQIREQERQSGRARTPIVALTAKVSDDAEQLCRNAGMDDFLAKPVRVGHMKTIVGRYAQRKAS